MSMKNSLTPAGIEPATFRFVVLHLNNCATAVPIVASGWLFISLYQRCTVTVTLNGTVIVRAMAHGRYSPASYSGERVSIPGQFM